MSIFLPAIPQIGTLRTFYAGELDADSARIQVSRGDDTRGPNRLPFHPDQEAGDVTAAPPVG